MVYKDVFDCGIDMDSDEAVRVEYQFGCLCDLPGEVVDILLGMSVGHGSMDLDLMPGPGPFLSNTVLLHCFLVTKS